ncbi:MAG: hypothetical protein IT290_12130 [Deltaproteobacteria bacterium]|nr:hypothetical protein [Deltaproteobacteria bacterium]
MIKPPKGKPFKPAPLEDDDAKSRWDPLSLAEAEERNKDLREKELKEFFKPSELKFFDFWGSTPEPDPIRESRIQEARQEQEMKLREEEAERNRQYEMAAQQQSEANTGMASLHFAMNQTRAKGGSTAAIITAPPPSPRAAESNAPASSERGAGDRNRAENTVGTSAPTAEERISNQRAGAASFEDPVKGEPRTGAGPAVTLQKPIDHAAPQAATLNRVESETDRMWAEHQRARAAGTQQVSLDDVAPAPQNQQLNHPLRNGERPREQDVDPNAAAPGQELVGSASPAFDFRRGLRGAAARTPAPATEASTNASGVVQATVATDDRAQSLTTELTFSRGSLVRFGEERAVVISPPDTAATSVLTVPVERRENPVDSPSVVNVEQREGYFTIDCRRISSRSVADISEVELRSVKPETREKLDAALAHAVGLSARPAEEGSTQPAREEPVAATTPVRETSATGAAITESPVTAAPDAPVQDPAQAAPTQVPTEPATGEGTSVTRRETGGSPLITRADVTAAFGAGTLRPPRSNTQK